jgi:hypothetical protein
MSIDNYQQKNDDDESHTLEKAISVTSIDGKLSFR